MQFPVSHQQGDHPCTHSAMDEKTNVFLHVTLGMKKVRI